MLFETREIFIDLPGRRVSLLVVKDVEKLITDPADEDKVPCWAEIWPAARGLARWIWDHLQFDGEELLELGSGLGLPGVVCGLKGARVTFSDFNPSALELAGLNASRNGLSDFKTCPGDWRVFKITKQFKWVMGSDVFYDPRLNVYLKGVITGVTTVGSTLLIAHPGRPATFQFIEELRTLAKIDEQQTVVPVIIEDPYFPYYDIHIHSVRFK